MIRYILFLFTILLPVKSLSQNLNNPYNSTEERFKSPQVHLLKQFVDHPVDLSRGLTDITIPVYDIKFADQTIPIKLMFHPSGLKANATENGILGLKWALNAGGFIAREVKGIPDEQRNHKQGITVGYTPDWMTLYGGGADRGYFNNNPVFRDNLGYIGYPWNTQGKYEDTEYDIFTFSLPNGQSGKFILKDNNGDKSASFMPYKPYKLSNPEVGYVYSNNQFLKFDITDDQGYIYSFGRGDSGTYCEFDVENKYTNSWMLTSITSPNKKEVIKFDYTLAISDGNSPLVPVTINDNLEDATGDYYFSGSCGVPSDDGALWIALKDIVWEHSGYLNKNYNPVPYHNNNFYQLTKITYNNLNVNFTYPGNQKLSKIEIVNDNKLIRKAEFNVLNNEQSYLNSIVIKGSTEDIVEKYSFDYYHLNKLPSMQNLANKADYWGYYQSEVQNVIQKDGVQILFKQPCSGQILLREEIGSGNNRYSNEEDMKIGMIKSITYPTGGTTTFDYESNAYKDNSNITRQCGGLRIKNIIDKDSNGTELKKREFTYGKNEDGIGKIPSYLMPDPNFINSFEENKTMYLIDDDTFPNMGYSIGTYTTRYMSGFFPGSYYTYLYNIVAYDKVTEYSGDINNNIGKVENYYSINIPAYSDYEFDYNSFTYQRYKYIIDPSNFWSGNHIFKKIEYNNENNSYSKVKQTDYLYADTVVDEFYDLSIFRFKNVVGYKTSGGTPHWSAITELEKIKDHPTEFFGYKLQKYTIGIENLDTTIEELFFSDSRSIVQTTTHKYDKNKPTFIKESTTINSTGEKLVQKFRYPFDINTGVYSQMSDVNVIAPLVEKVALKNDKVVNSTVLTYKKSDTNFVPDQNFVSELNIPVPYAGFTLFNGLTKDQHYSADPEITYDLYDDQGNPIQITPKGKASLCFVWGYDKKYPIAKIENATYLSGQANSISAAQQTLINTAVSASFGDTAPSTNLINKLKLLRAGFPNAMVTTYTYNPLIGITSITDPKDYTTYYEYDASGRLKQVKDNESKILSASKYHYTN